MTTQNKLFQISKPVGKKLFLDSYYDTVDIALLLVAPFGLSGALVDLLDIEGAKEELEATYKQWEDVVSRKVYAWKGIPDERVSATMHKFLEEDQDTEVIDSIRQAQRRIGILLSPAEVVDMSPTEVASSRPAYIPFDANICNANTLASIVTKILAAMNQIMPPRSDVEADGAVGQYDCKSVLAIDENAWNVFKVQIPVRQLQPHETISNVKEGGSSKRTSPFCDEGLKALLAALTVDVTSKVTGWSERPAAVKLTLDQYYVLLELYGQSDEVREAIVRHFGGEVSIPAVSCSGSTVIDQLRNAVPVTTIIAAAGEPAPRALLIDGFQALLVNPTAAYVEQLRGLLSSCEDEAVARAAKASLKLVRQAFRMKSKAKLAVEIGDTEKAIACLTAALNGTALAWERTEASSQPSVPSKATSAGRDGHGKKGKGKKGKRAHHPMSDYQDMFEMFESGMFDQGGMEGDDDDEEDEDDNDFFHDGGDMDDEDEDEDEEEEDDEDEEDDDADADVKEFYRRTFEQGGGFDFEYPSSIPRNQFKNQSRADEDEQEEAEDEERQREELDADEDEQERYAAVMEDLEDEAKANEAVEGMRQEWKQFFSDAVAPAEEESAALPQAESRAASEPVAVATSVQGEVSSESIDIAFPEEVEVEEVEEVVEGQDPEPAAAVGTSPSEGETPLPWRQESAKNAWGDSTATTAPEVKNVQEPSPQAPVSAAEAADTEAVIADQSDSEELPMDAGLLLPVHLKVILLHTRAKLFIESGLLEEALQDCTTILALDPRHAKSYALRAQILGSFLAAAEEAGDFQGDDLDKQTKLKAAAKDALAAFLLSGCSDLEMAGAAEDAAREACRLDAKASFVSKSTVAAQSASRPMDSNVLPKAWLMSSYFNGYEPLFDAFSVDPLSCSHAVNAASSLDFDVEREFAVGYTAADLDTVVAADAEERLDDIDVEEGECAAGADVPTVGGVFRINTALPLPPVHLRDSNINLIGEEAAGANNNKHVIHSLDAEAYSLLSSLLLVLDPLTMDSGASAVQATASLSFGDDDSDDSDDDEDDVGKIAVMVPEVAADLQDLLDFSCEARDSGFLDNEVLLAQGRLKYVDVDEELATYTSAAKGKKVKSPEQALFEMMHGGSGADDDDEEEDKVALQAAEKALEVKTFFDESTEWMQRGISKQRRDARREAADASASKPPAAVMDPLTHIAAISAPSESFLKAVALLSTKTAHVLTGVTLSSSGFVLSSSTVTGVEKVDASSGGDEEGDWEDCDDDDDDEDEDADGDEDNEESEESSQRTAQITTVDSVLQSRALSFALQARLLSLVSSIAYLAGDSNGSVACLKNALLACRSHLSLCQSTGEDAEKPTSMLVDCLIKLASLLTDMDEVEEAVRLFREANELAQKNAYVYLHWAELEIHQNQFSESISLLRKAKRLGVYKPPVSPQRHHHLSKQEAQVNESRLRHAREQLQSSIYSLLGVAIFRQSPMQPELSLRELQEGVDSFPQNLYLQLCLGEVLTQAGDAVGAMKAFKRASALDPLHPLPYVNAARTYQQLGHLSQATKHLTRAIAADPQLAMTRVDLSQQYLHSGRSSEALQTLDEALVLARHVSEIRDVLTARAVATMQLELQQEGLHSTFMTV